MATEAGIRKPFTVSILGCGWLGKALSIALKNNNVEVCASTTRQERLAELAALGLRPFLIRLDSHTTNFSDENFFLTDILVVSIPPRGRVGQGENYLQQIKSLREKLESVKAKPNILFFSSTAVYRDEPAIVTESDADAENPLTKAELVFTVDNAFPATVLRFGGLVGPGRHPGRFLAGKVGVKGAQHPVNLIHQADAVEICLQVILQNRWGEVFNACASFHPSRNEFYTRAAKLIGLEPPQFEAGDNSTSKIVSNRKVRENLSYEFIHDDPMMMGF